MASIIPNEVSTSLAESQGGLGEILTNVEHVMQTVGSVWDQIRGMSQGVEGQSFAPAQPSTPTPTQGSLQLDQNTAVMVAIGAVVFVGLLVILK